MKTKLTLATVALLSTFTTFYVAQPSTCFAQGTAFTYQGRLNDGASPANGKYDLTFTLFVTNITGVAIAGPVTNSAIAVSNGLFTVTLDFGANFPGSDRWLEIAVRTNGGGAFTTLAPRQPLTPTPYAIYAEGANAAGISGTLPATTLGGTYSNAVTFNNGADVFDGTFIGQFLGSSFIGGIFTGQFVGDGSGLINLSASQLKGTVPSAGLSGTYPNAVTFNNSGNSFNGNGSGLTGVNAAALNGLNATNFWETSGNGGTSPTNGNFIGTTDSQPLEFRVNGARALRLESTTDNVNISNAVNVVGGSPGNFVAAGVQGATIAGGGTPFYLGGGATNSVLGNFGAIGGGLNNQIQSNALESTIAGGIGNMIDSGAANSIIGGGYFNTILPGAHEATIAGGSSGTIGTNDINAFIGGGWENLIQDNGIYAVVAGGWDNVIQHNGQYAAIGGGLFNFNDAANAVIAGGQGNQIGDDAIYGSIGGGAGNTILGEFSTISGGLNNTVQSNGVSATVSGGTNNIIQSNTSESTIAGGMNNLVQSSTFAAVISGGYSNTANGTLATIPGGDQNVATNNALAAGHRAKANNTGSFVWADSTDADFASTASNQFDVRASGGVAFVTGGAGMALDGLAVLTTAGGLAGLTIQQNTNGAPNVIEGAQNNSVSSGVVGAAIGGGGATNYSGFTYINSVSADFGTVSGGADNTASGQYAAVGGGFANTASGQYAVVSGGQANVAAGNTAVVGGGDNNHASGSYSVVAGGDHNTASGDFSTVSGGQGNVAAGVYSFAAGNAARANYQGDFVWADSQLAPFSSTANDQFWVRAKGGVNFQATAGVVMNVSGSSGLNPAALLVNSTSANGVAIYAAQTSSDATLVLANSGTGDIIKGFDADFGGNAVFEVKNDGTVYSRAVQLTSDRNAKENFAAINPAAVLDKIASLPITQWNYKADHNDVQHIGPMAQDFQAAFSLNGSDDKHISVVDEGGVALAAIQGLNQKMEEKEKRIQEQESRVQNQTAEITDLKARLDALEKIIRNQKSN